MESTEEILYSIWKLKLIQISSMLAALSPLCLFLSNTCTLISNNYTCMYMYYSRGQWNLTKAWKVQISRVRVVDWYLRINFLKTWATRQCIWRKQIGSVLQKLMHRYLGTGRILRCVFLRMCKSLTSHNALLLSF